MTPIKERSEKKKRVIKKPSPKILAPLVQHDSLSDSEPETLPAESIRNITKTSNFRLKPTVVRVSLTERQTPEKPLLRSQSSNFQQAPKWVRLNEQG